MNLMSVASFLGIVSVTSLGAVPLDIPTIFSPGAISGPAHDSAPAFSPDGRTVYLTQSSPAASLIVTSRRIGGRWSKPVVAPFSGRWNDMEPAMAPDGSYLIFVSNRPAQQGGEPIDGMINGKPQPRKGANLWRVDRTKSGWSAPIRLSDTVNSSPSTYAPNIAANGDLYFMRPDGPDNRFRLFVAPFRSGTYQTPEPLSFSTGTYTDVDPAILPNGSAIVFGSDRHAKKDIDLFIAFRKGGDWGTPIYLGDAVNSPTSDAEPRWAPNGHSLYFSSERVLNVPQPILAGQRNSTLADMVGWNNGLYNIWTVDLQYLLESGGRK